MVAVPGDTPVTAPVAVLTVTLPLGLLQLPLVGVAVSVTVEFWHTWTPVLVITGSEFTVTTVLRVQPFALVNMMVVLPDAIPPATPPGEEIVPMAGETLIHVPPAAGVLLSVVVVPMHTPSIPVMVVGVSSIVTIAVVKQPVGVV